MPAVWLRPWRASDPVTSAGITQADQPAGELSYWLLPAARGRGLAQAGVEAMLETIVNPMGLRSAVPDIEPSNVPSVRLAGRIGAERREPPRIATDRTRIRRTRRVRGEAPLASLGRIGSHALLVG